MYGIYADIYHQYTPNVSINIPAPWILWVILIFIPNEHPLESSERTLTVLVFPFKVASLVICYIAIEAMAQSK